MPQTIFLTASKYDKENPKLQQVQNLIQSLFPEKSVQLVLIDPDTLKLPQIFEIGKSIMIHCSFSSVRLDEQFIWDTVLFQAQNHGYLLIFDNQLANAEKIIPPLNNHRKTELREYGLDEDKLETYTNIFGLDVQRVPQPALNQFIEKICSTSFPQRKKISVQNDVSLISLAIPYVASFAVGAITGLGIGASISYFAVLAPPLLITCLILGTIIGGFVGLAICYGVKQWDSAPPYQSSNVVEAKFESHDPHASTKLNFAQR